MALIIGGVIHSMKWRLMIAGAALATTLAVTPVQGIFAQATDANKEALLQAYEEMLQHYSKPDQDKLLEAAIEGMIEAVDDPYTNYMAPDEYKAFMDSINQDYAGIGIMAVADEKRKGIVIQKVFSGTPAEKSGLLVGDLIVQVDDHKGDPGNLLNLNTYIRGKEGTSVTLHIVRDDKPLVVKPVREVIRLPLVESTDAGDGIRMISISSFGDRTVDEFQKAYNEALASGAKGLILDLRGNGGGLVNSALTIADLFLKKGNILIFHDEEGNKQVVEADEDGTDIPLAVLIDENSASASEMLAGSLQNNKRAKLIGTTSFGKGTMQAPANLPNGSVMKVSIERWELPDGTVIDRKGITPDIKLNYRDLYVNAAVQALVPTRTQELKLIRSTGAGTLNGKEFVNAPKPVVRYGQVYVPLRFMLEAFGSEVRWSKEATSFTLGGKTYSLKNNADIIKVDGASYVKADALSRLIGKPITVTSDAVTMKF
jgi:carboxyl-terminal processing protease